MNRSTIILFVLLLVLGAIALFLLPSSKEREMSDKVPEMKFEIDSSSIVKLEIVRGVKSTTLENVGGRWMVTAPGRYQADPQAVSQVIEGLTKFHVGSLISSNPEKQKLFQVDSSGTLVMTTSRSGKTTSIIIGKMGPSFSEVYCRVPASKDVYLGEGLDSWVVNRELREWRDKTMMIMPVESVKELTYAAGGRQFEFHRDSTVWKTGSLIVETSVMNPPLNALSNLKADDFVDTGLSVQSQPISVTVKGVDLVTLQMYPSLPDSSKYFVRSSGSQQVFVLNKYAAQQILKPLESQEGLGRGHGAVAARKTEPVSKPPVVVKAPVKQPEKAPVVVEKKPETAPVVAEKKPAVVEKKPEQKPKVTPPQTADKTPGSTGQPLISEKKPVTRQTPAVTPSGTGKKAGKQEVKQPVTEQAPLVTEKKTDSSAAPPKKEVKQSPAAVGDDEGELTVYTVKKGETMPIIAKRFNCTVDQILKWNLLKSINVKPGQELYIYVKK